MFLVCAYPYLGDSSFNLSCGRICRYFLTLEFFLTLLLPDCVWFPSPFLSLMDYFDWIVDLEVVLVEFIHHCVEGNYLFLLWVHCLSIYLGEYKLILVERFCHEPIWCDVFPVIVSIIICFYIVDGLCVGCHVILLEKVGRRVIGSYVLSSLAFHTSTFTFTCWLKVRMLEFTVVIYLSRLLRFSLRWANV